jgi:hypothetical protein
LKEEGKQFEFAFHLRTDISKDILDRLSVDEAVITDVENFDQFRTVIQYELYQCE